ncbi:MAG: glycosyltransferase [Verrucomicrobiota bacterium]|jgi:glycosyltransferase involved in cell wall biosynthesis|nr:glycosyltransferase [Verrucomicrobiota bacterium]
MMKVAIESYSGVVPAGARLSILIPSWNNLPYLKLCVNSIRRYSTHPHQIIVHVNDGSDGTLDWVREQQLDHTYSPENVGICFAMNLGRTLVQTDYVAFMNDDMVVCPGWDTALLEEIAALPDKYFFLSATMLEPYPTNSKPVIAPADYGREIEDFDEAKLLREFHQYEKADWCGATRPPNVVHRDVWDLVGGYSVEFSPGFYSDPDFAMKLWQAGVRHFRGIGRSRVYHFVSKSLVRVQPNPGRRQFLKKWGMTSSTFTRLVLQLGKPYEEWTPPNPQDPVLRRAWRKNRFQQLFLPRTLPELQ